MLLLAAITLGQVYLGTERNLRVDIPRIESTVEVDGRLNEPVWQQAARLTGFSQYAPDDGRPAGNQTEVLVWYSPNAVHFGIRAHAAPGSIRATLADRDHIDSDDQVQIFLSTFNDGRQASVFGVNPFGVQMDGAVVEGAAQGAGGFGGVAAGRTAPDLSPDFVFESKGHLTDYGYEIEVRIPFKSLRYQSAAAQDWGIHVIRRIQSAGHEDSWAPARRSAASFLAQAGTLAGLRDLHRGLVMDLNPVVTVRADGHPSTALGAGPSTALGAGPSTALGAGLSDSGWTYDGHRPDVGGNIRWGLTNNLTMNATVNPDFSQVEADATQFQIDPRQALFFAEKRPFFLDGIEFFQTPNSLVYSRRIAAPVAAVKLTGKVAGTTVAALSAVDDPSTSLGGGNHPVFTIVRIQRDVGGASRAAFVYTNRLDGAATNHVAGADAHLVFRKIYALDLQGAVSRTTSGGGATGGLPRETSTGPLWQAQLRRSGRRFSAQYSLNANAPDFRAAAGFIGRQGIVNGFFQNQISLYGKPGALVEKWTGDVQIQTVWNYDSFFAGAQALERKLHFDSNFFFKHGWHSAGSVLVERYGFDPAIYSNYAVLGAGGPHPIMGQTLPNLDYLLSLDTPRVRGVSANLFVIWGRDENFFEWASANIVYSTANLAWRPTERLRVDLSHNLQSFARRTDGSYVGIRRVPRVKVEYQATRHIFVRYVGEHATNYQDALRDDSRTGLPIVFVARDGTITPASAVRTRSFRNDWLFSYQPRPGTVLFAGYGNTLSNPGTDQLRRDLRRTRDGFFLKLSYLFRM